jgi:hypothetical protein
MDDQRERRVIPTVSNVLEDGTIIELLYRSEEHRTHLALFSSGRWTVVDHIDLPQLGRLVPFSPDNNLIRNEVVLLPSEPRLYGDEQTLVAEIARFIHQFADLTPVFERVACYYVLLSWCSLSAFGQHPHKQTIAPSRKGEGLVPHSRVYTSLFHVFSRSALIVNIIAARERATNW